MGVSGRCLGELEEVEEEGLPPLTVETLLEEGV